MHSNLISDTVENFLDTHPELECEELEFEERVTGENPTVRLQHVRIGNETYLITAKRVGG